ncbi:MAG: PQQ-binding-like beta-propeller repeat protein [Paludibacter sp.]|jgi:outer membrane protein assembly factor BamB|nr:PQQ-binding-like beta-propeller repeat protein [Paludibacter sp.]
MKNKLLLLILVSLGICINIKATTWTSYALVDGARKGYVKASNPVFSPDGNTIYIPTSTPNGHLFAVNRATGAINWVFEITSITYGGGAVVGSDGTIYQGARDKKVYAINPDGTQKWAFTGIGNFDAFPALSADGVIYYLANGTTNSTLYALNAGTGAEIWNKTITGTTGGAVAIDNVGNVYAGTNSKVVKYNAAGDLQWETTAGSLLLTEIGSFAIDSGRNRLYAALRGTAGIAAIDMANGDIKWTRASGGDSYFPIVGPDGTIYFNEKLAAGKVYAVNPDGTEKWTTTIGGSMNYGGLVLSDTGKLYGGTQSKIGTYYQVFEVDATTGTKTVILETSHQLSASATIGPDNKLYIASIREGVSPLEDNGRLFVFDINAGLEKKSWSMRGNDIQGLNRRTAEYVSSDKNISSIAATSTIDVTVLSGLLTIDDDASVKSLTVNPGAKLTLAAGKTLTVADAITLQSDATGTGTLIDSYESPTVNASVQQYLPQGRNWYVASPIESTIAPASATGLTVSGAASSVSYYDETQNGTSNAWFNNYTGNLLRGVGYVAVSSSGTGTNNIELSGTLNSGNVPVTLTRTGTGGFAGYNLIANPYPSYINPMSAMNSLNVEKTIWYRTKGSTYKFETVNTTTGVGTDAALSGNAVTDYIPPMQAFWVRTNVNNVQLVFTNAMRTHANPVVGETTINTTALKAPQQQMNQIARINISGSNGSDQAVLYFNGSASNGFDAFDSRKMFESASASTPEIFLLAEAEKVAINGMQSIPYDTEIPVGIVIKQPGNFSISRTELSNFEPGTRILLKDKLYPSSEFELAEGAGYNFSSQPTSSNTDRFSLVFRSPGVTTQVENASHLNAQVFVNAAHQIIIIAPSNSPYAVFNTMGQKVNFGSTSSEVQHLNLSSGMYVVKVNDITRKIIIK